MSAGTSPGPNPGAGDELAVLAGEFVLGTLPPEERNRLAGEAATDAVLALAILRWERHLAPLLSATALAPPAGLWARIEASRLGAPGSAVPPPSGFRRLRAPRGAMHGTRRGAWRGLAAVGLLAAGLAGLAVFGRAPPPRLLAVLAPVGAAPAAFALEWDGRGRLVVAPIAPAPVPAGHDLELWSLPDRATVPVPLGVLPPGGVRLAAASLPPGRSRILVSLEPPGGSPTGLPTGPVLYGAVLVRPE